MTGRRPRLWIHVALFVATAFTATAAGAAWEGADPFGGAKGLLRGLPFSLSLLAILFCHEMGHYLMCMRHGVDASPPYFVPGIPLLPFPGTFGAVIRVRSRFPNRKALFDMGAGGPWAGFVVALVVMIVGLRLSRVDPSAHGGLLFGDSLLTAALARLVLGAEPDTVVVHPVAVAGWFGLFITSLNLIPAGQLDGGHILYAATGRRTTWLGALLAAIAAWLTWRVSENWLLWVLIIVLMTRLGHPPTLDDGASVGLGRLAMAASSLILLVVTFVPDPIRIMP